MTIKPGQNTISFDGDDVPRPKRAGWIVGFRPNLEYTNGKIPGVDVIHLHHAVWLINGRLTFAAGEEKTNVKLPRPLRLAPRARATRGCSTTWSTTCSRTAARVYLTYTLDFIPDSSPAGEEDAAGRDALGRRPGRQRVPGLRRRTAAAARTGASPIRATSRTPTRGGPRAQPDAIQRDGVLVQTAGHLHPGGLYTDLMLTRNGRTVNLFRSRAKYWEPAGAVSWDVAMTATRPNWRIKVKRGDMLSVSATYDSKRASWYESMGIMPVAFAPGARGGVDPFSGRIERRGRITHGHLPENDNHGGEAGGLADARTLPDGPAAAADPLAITDFLYGQGDLLRGGAASRPPVVAAGQPLALPQRRRGAHDLPHHHRLPRPCNRTTGIAYPLADGPVDFDSGELGFGPAGFTPAANRDTWSTPANLGPGTYTYFCRVHPFMRGAFRVKG